MDNQFSRSIDTLRTAQSTMAAQLRRHSSAPSPDSVRLPRLRMDAVQMRSAALALLQRMRLEGSDPSLQRTARQLASFFDASAFDVSRLLQGAKPTEEDDGPEVPETASAAQLRGSVRSDRSRLRARKLEQLRGSDP